MKNISLSPTTSRAGAANFQIRMSLSQEDEAKTYTLILLATPCNVVSFSASVALM